MRYISHRGNITGREAYRENTIEYIQEALDKGYDVEVDVWYVGGKLYLGHNYAQEEVSLEFLNDERLWVHCKDVKALEICLKNQIHCFFHNEDDATITSYGYIWVYPNKELGITREMSVAVLPEYNNSDTTNCYGICSDNIENYKNMKE